MVRGGPQTVAWPPQVRALRGGWNCHSPAGHGIRGTGPVPPAAGGRGTRHAFRVAAGFMLAGSGKAHEPAGNVQALAAPGGAEAR